MNTNKFGVEKIAKPIVSSPIPKELKPSIPGKSLPFDTLHKETLGTDSLQELMENKKVSNQQSPFNAAKSPTPNPLSISKKGGMPPVISLATRFKKNAIREMAGLPLVPSSHAYENFVSPHGLMSLAAIPLTGLAIYGGYKAIQDDSKYKPSGKDVVGAAIGGPILYGAYRGVHALQHPKEASLMSAAQSHKYLQAGYEEAKREEIPMRKALDLMARDKGYVSYESADEQAQADLSSSLLWNMSRESI